jgi:hypothetical protein
MMRQPGAAALRRTHQTIKIKEKDAPDREIPGFVIQRIGITFRNK